ncbi:MAG: DUF885 domain-containing protein [Myxococcales bacterium]|nr:DUF885 domain-containing protein [Myxococcales bacterium]
MRRLRAFIIAATLLIGLLVAGTAFARNRSITNLNAIADDYYWALQARQLRPNFSKRGNEAWVAKLRNLELRLKHIKSSNLDQQSRITFKMLAGELETQRRYITRGWIKEDINGTESPLHTMVSAIEASELKSVNDWRWTIKTLKSSARFIDSYIKLLQQGIAEDRTRARDVIESSIKSLGVLTSRSKRKNPFLALEGQLEKALAGKPQLKALRRELRAVVHDTVLPAHDKLKTFLKKEYLPHAGPLGASRERYLHHMALHLGKKHRTPESLAEWGRREVERLQKELLETAKKLDPNVKDVRAFMGRINRQKSTKYESGQALIDATQKEITRSNELARMHLALPKSKVTVTRVPKHQEATVAAQYMPTGDMTGTMMVNTGKLLKGQRRYDLATLVTHEVAAGHHVAAMYAEKQKDLPAYRVGHANTAFDEGWALYSEQLRDDQRKGFTPYERIGFLVNHLWRAARLVVDTGLHTGAMTRTQAVRYFRTSTFTDKVTAEAEIQRYIDWPGQALAYYVGKRRMLKTRRAVKRILGEHYDARKFHAKLLSQGSIPPERLHKVMVKWANRRLGQVARTRPRTRTRVRTRRARR